MSRQSSRFALLIATLSQVLALGVNSSVRAQSPNQVGLVVQFGDGRTITRCITFPEPEINGFDILQRSGLETVASHISGSGAAICAIEGEGCGAADCFCQCRGSTCVYWSFWRLDGGAWIYAPLGGTMTTAHHGDVEGWRWGKGQPPAAIVFDQICAAQPAVAGTPPATPAMEASSATPTATDLPASSAGRAVPVGYAVFALLGGSLVGWLIFERRRRR